jgi:hypothetical protein
MKQGLAYFIVVVSVAFGLAILFPAAAMAWPTLLFFYEPEGPKKTGGIQSGLEGLFEDTPLAETHEQRCQTDPPWFLFVARGDDKVDVARCATVREARIDPVLSDYSFLSHLPNLATVSTVESPPVRIPQSLIDALASCQSLKHINIVGDVSGLDLSTLGRLPHLDSLSLTNATITASTLTQLAGLSGLRSLELAPPKFATGASQLLGKLVNIKELKLSGLITDGVFEEHDLSFLSNLPQLESLHAVVPDNQLQVVLNLQHLSVLDVGANISDEAVSKFAALPELKALRVCSELVTGRWLEAFRDKPLQYLSVDNCSSLTHEALARIAEMKTLKGLDISFTPATDEDAAALAKLPHLRRLVMNELRCATAFGALKVSRAQPDCVIVCVREFAEGGSWQPVNAYSYRQKLELDKAMADPSTPEYALARKHGQEPGKKQVADPRSLSAVQEAQCLAELYLRQAHYKECMTLCRQSLQNLLFIADSTRPGQSQQDRAELKNECRDCEVFFRLRLAECLTKCNKAEQANAILKELPPLGVCGRSFPWLYNDWLYESIASIRNHRSNARENVDRLFALVNCVQLAAMPSPSAIACQKLAMAYCYAGDFSEALKLQNQAYTEIEGSLGSVHPLSATYLAIRATILTHEKQYAAAERLFKIALDHPNMWSGDNYELADVYDGYADLLKSTGRYQDALVEEKNAINYRLNPQPIRGTRCPPATYFKGKSNSH